LPSPSDEDAFIQIISFKVIYNPFVKPCIQPFKDASASKAHISICHDGRETIIEEQLFPRTLTLFSPTSAENIKQKTDKQLNRPGQSKTSSTMSLSFTLRFFVNPNNYLANKKDLIMKTLCFGVIPRKKLC
jgi:hypothetical protein